MLFRYYSLPDDLTHSHLQELYHSILDDHMQLHHALLLHNLDDHLAYIQAGMHPRDLVSNLTDANVHHALLYDVHPLTSRDTHDDDLPPHDLLASGAAHEADNLVPNGLHDVSVSLANDHALLVQLAPAPNHSTIVDDLDDNDLAIFPMCVPSLYRSVHLHHQVANFA
jgi:hypothetical protein